MKNQYVGDIGDFGKYALLRAFSEAGIRVGINWYLTENDGSNDGKFVDYLEKESLRWMAPEVFDALKPIAKNSGKSVFDVQEAGILKDAIYYPELLKCLGKSAERKKQREEWFAQSLDVLSGADLIFMDPDNGLLVDDNPAKKDSEKYVLPSEVEKYFRAGYSVVYYCHKGRRKYGDWQEYISLMFDRVKAAKPAVLTYHKGSQRSYVFLIQEKDFIRYRHIIDRFMTMWHRYFSEEYTTKGSPAGETVGEAFIVERADGEKVTIKKRADGKIQITSSKRPGVSYIQDVDLFIRNIMYMWMR